MPGAISADNGETLFFISRAGADAPFAAVIGSILEDAGYRVILQQWDLANRNFMEGMHAALESGARVIALLSSAYFKSDHCLAEALNTIGHDPLNKNAAADRDADRGVHSGRLVHGAGLLGSRSAAARCEPPARNRAAGR